MAGGPAHHNVLSKTKSSLPIWVLFVILLLRAPVRPQGAGDKGERGSSSCWVLHVASYVLQLAGWCFFVQIIVQMLCTHLVQAIAESFYRVALYKKSIDIYVYFVPNGVQSFNSLYYICTKHVNIDGLFVVAATRALVVGGGAVSAQGHPKAQMPSR